MFKLLSGFQLAILAANNCVPTEVETTTIALILIATIKYIFLVILITSKCIPIIYFKIFDF